MRSADACCDNTGTALLAPRPSLQPASAGFWRDIAVRDFHWHVEPDQEHFSSNFDLRKARRVDQLKFPPFSGCDAVASSKNKLTCVA